MNKREKATRNINSFLTMFQGILKLAKVRIGINTKTGQIIVQDSETNVVGKVDILKFNNLISDSNNEIIEPWKARKIMECTREVASYLTEDEAESLLQTLLIALNRMDSEVKKDDIHNILK